MTKILIIDDELSASNILKILIEQHISIEKEIRVCHSAFEALDVIPAYRPDLLMLDIEMPHLNGFDLLNKLGSWDFDTIFTTAFDQYAIKAIRFSALDYLLKPIDIVDLQHAIYRHIHRRNNKTGTKQALMGNLLDNLRQNDSSSFKLALSTMEGYYFFPPKDIVRCEGDDNYTRFHLTDGTALIVSRTLKEFEEILADHHFIRVHKSHLVNMAHVTRFDKESLIWLDNGICIPVSRRKRPLIVRYF